MYLSVIQRGMSALQTDYWDNYRIIATSNVTAACDGEFEYVLNFSALMDPSSEFIDNSFVMFLKVLINIGVSKVTLAGFDGYNDKESIILTAARNMIL